jgi:hypothetical protein
MRAPKFARRRRGSAQFIAAISAVTVATLAFSLGAADQASARQIGAYNVGGAIEVEYDQAGGFGRFGNPTQAEWDAAYGGKFQVFEKNTSIYWHPDTGANQVGGRIRDKWRDFGWETGNLHYPTTRERVTPQRPGAFNHFQGGSVYWSPNTDAHQIWGMVRDQWGAAGWENSPYGFPKTDEYVNQEYSDGFRQDFENGSIQVIDMKVPAYGYVDPSVAAREADPQSSGTEETSPETLDTETQPLDPSGSVTTTETADPSTLPEVTEEETSVRPTPPASLIPTTPGVADPPSGNSGGDPNVMTPMTWPFGDFCVIGTYGGPGGACRFGDGVSLHDATCMASIVAGTATNVIPIAKLLKVRQYIKAVGGAREAFERWNGQKSVAQRAIEWSKGGKIAQDVATEFLGLGAIVAACR